MRVLSVGRFVLECPYSQSREPLVTLYRTTVHSWRIGLPRQKMSIVNRTYTSSVIGFSNGRAWPGPIGHVLRISHYSTERAPSLSELVRNQTVHPTSNISTERLRGEREHPALFITDVSKARIVVCYWLVTFQSITTLVARQHGFRGRIGRTSHILGKCLISSRTPPNAHALHRTFTHCNERPRTPPNAHALHRTLTIPPNVHALHRTLTHFPERSRTPPNAHALHRTLTTPPNVHALYTESKSDQLLLVTVKWA